MIENSTSWSKLSNINEQIRPHEQIEFWPHDRKFDLKKLNLDLMKFDLMIMIHFGSNFNYYQTVFVSYMTVLSDSIHMGSNFNKYQILMIFLHDCV
jgi:hypothetical protein